MKFNIYQINRERDSSCAMFMDMEFLEKVHSSTEVNSAVYDKVYSGETEGSSLEDVYRKFNIDHLPDYTGRSLSVSDVVEITEAENLTPGFYFCDSIGFKKIPFEPQQAAEQIERNTILVILLEPGKLARQADIDASLEGMQGVVGGYIEAIYPFEEQVCIVCNEEGKLSGLPLNRAVYQENEMIDIIAGTCFICDCSGENFGSLSSEQLEKFKKQFLYPEQFFKVNDEIKAVKYNPTEKNKIR